MKKLILIPVLAVTAVLVAGGCVFKKPAQPSVEGSQKSTSTEGDVATSTQDVDMSDWKTYRNEELGFEMKIPPEWGSAEVWMQQEPQVHPETDEDTLFPLFYDAVGRIDWRQETANSFVEITGVVKNSTSTISLGEASALIGISYDESQVVRMNGCEAIMKSTSNPPPKFKQNFGAYDSMLIKCDHSFFQLNADIVATSQEVGEKYKHDWIKAVSTFKASVR